MPSIVPPPLQFPNPFAYSPKINSNSPNNLHHIIFYIPSSFKHDTFNNFLSHFPPNILVMSFPLYIHILLPFICYSSHNPYVHLPSYLSTNTYPNQQSNLVIQNISLIFLLLRFEDVKLNLGPCSHIVPSLPPNYKACSSIYFIPNTIKFESKYQHLAQNFIPHLIHQPAKSPFPFTPLSLHTNTYFSPLSMTIIVTLGPSPNTCELIPKGPGVFSSKNIPNLPCLA